MTKRFIFKADCSFDAENIDDALLKLSKHFRSLVEDEDYLGATGFLETGEMHLEPRKKDGRLVHRARGAV